MSVRFIASTHADQNIETVRQFQRLQIVLDQMEDRLRPVTGTTEYGALVLADTWAAVPIVSSDIPTDKGTYSINLSMFVVGSAGNAEVQFRWTVSGVPIVTGQIMSIGNASMQITDTFFLSQSIGLTLEARGVSASITEGEADVFRVGIAP